MSTGDRGRIVSYYGPVMTAAAAPVQYTVPEHDRWRNCASQAAVRSMALDPNTGEIWLASAGGVRAVNAAGARPSYRRYASEHGLPGNAMHTLCADTAGRIWVAGDEGGLACFTGGRWRIYADDQRYGSLRHSRVRVLAAAQEGGVWAATQSGVYRLPAPDQNAVPLAVAAPHALAGVRALLDTPAGLLAGSPAGLFCVGGAVGEAVAPEVIRACVALAAGEDGITWAASPDTLYRLKTGVAAPVFTLPAGPLPGQIAGLAVTPGRVWVLAASGLFVWSAGAALAVPPAPGRRFDLAAICPHSQARSDYVWVGGSRLPGDGFAGIYVDLRAGAPAAASPIAPAGPAVPIADDAVRWDLDLLTPYADDGVMDGSARRLLPAATGGALWIGGGVGLLRRHGEQWDAAPDGALHWLGDDVRTLCPDRRQDIWLLAWPVGVVQLAEDGGLGRYPGPGLPTALAVGHDNQPYCVTGRGLWRLDREGWKLVIPGLPAHPSGLVQTSEPGGALEWWLGSANGLHRGVAGGRWQAVYAAAAGAGRTLHQVAVYCLLTLPDAAGDVLWVGTDAGLWRHCAGAWELHDPASLVLPTVENGANQVGTERAVVAVAASTQGRLWLACAGGVLRYDPAARQVDPGCWWTPLNSGLASSRVRDLLELPGALWIATVAGVSRIRLVENISADHP